MMADHPKIVSDELVYKGRVAEMHKVSLQMPAGAVVQRDLVRYPGAAVIVPVMDDGSIVMIRNYRFAVQEWLLELPAGNLDPGENPSVAAGRELVEETGYTAANIELLGSFYTTPGSTTENMYAYLAQGLRPGRQELEQYEQIQVEVVPQDRILAIISDKTLHDGKSIAALALYFIRRGNWK